MFSLKSIGPEGGDISIIRGSIDDNVVLAVSRNSQLYRSTNGGDTWYEILFMGNQIFQKAEIRDIVFHPYNDNQILLVTSQGFFKSEDQGITWTSSNTFPQPTNAVAYAAASPNVIFGANDDGVVKSTDGGSTWNQLIDNMYFGKRSVNHIAVHPADTNNFRIFVSTSHFDTSLTTKFLWSNNGGVSWKTMTKGLDTIPGNTHKIFTLKVDTLGIGRKGFRLIAGTPEGIIYAQSDQKDTAWGALQNKSTPIKGVIADAAVTYTLFNNPDSSLFQIYVAANPGAYDSAPKAFEENKYGVFRINASIKSSPAFWGWTNVFKNFYAVNGIHVSYSGGIPKIYLGTSDGIYVSTDGGTNWSSKNAGIYSSMAVRPISSPAAGGNKYITVGSFGGGIKRTSDNGLTWNASNLGMVSPYVFETVTDPKNPRIIYAATSCGVSRSIDAGLNWTSILTIDSSIIIKRNNFTVDKSNVTIRVSPVSSSLILVCSPAIGYLLNTDGGLTAKWNRITPPAGDTIDAFEHIQFDPVNQNTIYLGTNKLWKSTDLGSHWNDISGNLPQSIVDPESQTEIPLQYFSPAVNPRNTDEIFIPSVDQSRDGMPSYVYHTLNGGVTWNSLSVKGFALLLDRFDPANVLCSGPEGIFNSTNSGKTWERISDSTGNENPVYLFLSPAHDSDYVYYVGSLSGVYELVLKNYARFHADSLAYHFGVRQLNNPADTLVAISNPQGKRRLVLSLENMSDTTHFKYFGEEKIFIEPDSTATFSVSLVTKTAGLFVTVLTFRTNDPAVPRVAFTVTGGVIGKVPIEKFNYNFGSVLVGKDSSIVFQLDNTEGIEPIQFSLRYMTDTVNFRCSDSLIAIEPGKIKTVSVHFSPVSTGMKFTNIMFASTDSRLPVVTLRFQGFGVLKNFLARSVLIDTGMSFSSLDSVRLSDSYSDLSAGLKKAGITVTLSEQNSFAQYNAVMIANPQKPIISPLRDSLQKFVVNGGMLVLLGNGDLHGSNSALNEFLSNPSWKEKYQTATGIALQNDMLYDTTFSENRYSGMLISTPTQPNVYLTKVDTIVFLKGSRISVDTSTRAHKLLVVASQNLLSQSDSMTTKISSAVTGAFVKIGAGTIIVLNDYHLWSNGNDDSTNNFGIRAAQNLQFALNVFGVTDNYLARLANATAREKYTLISIPYILNDSLAANIFKDLGVKDNYTWRMFGKWNEKENRYKEFPEDFVVIRRGEGYWLITKDERSINLGTATVPGTAEDFSITLQPGWNLIGNPFPYRVSWKNSYRDSNVENALYAYHSKYSTVTTTMEPFEGYFIKNRASMPKTIRINSTQVSNAKEELENNELFSGEWMMRIIAKSPSAIDDENYLGMLRNASDSLDDYDYSKPPAAPEAYISLAFLLGKDKLTTDFRAVSSEGGYWDFSVAASESNIPISLQTELLGTVPASFKKYLVDFSAERVTDISELQEYSLNLKKNEYSRKLRLIVGTEKFVEKNTAGIPIIPIAYSLEQNFPNPFNPVTTIRYSLSHSSFTHLEIFNILGQKIKILIKQPQQIGVYSIEWDGTNDSGVPVSSGMYYYRLVTEEFSAVKKMILIK